MSEHPLPPVVTFRSFEERDLPALLDLWETESGWGRLSEADWRTWHLDSPYGPSIIVVAEDQRGSIAGQAVFARTPMVVDGRDVSAVRLSAPILRSDLRSASMRRRDHPVVLLYFAGIDAARHAGVELMFARPAASWEPFFRVMKRMMPWSPGASEFCPRVFESFGCVERPADCPPVALPTHLAVSADVADAEFDLLWDRASQELPVHCGAVRDARFAHIRNGRFQTYGARSTAGELLAYVSIDLHARLIVDSLGVSVDAIRQALAAVVSRVLRDAPGLLKAMETPLLARTFAELGFLPSDYRFLLVADWIDGARDASPIAVDRWHLGAQD